LILSSRFTKLDLFSYGLFFPTLVIHIIYLMIKSRLVRPAGFIEPCIPVLETKPPIGDQWVHEIKCDGYRLQVHRNGERVRIFTRRGFDWTDRFPVIASAALTLKADRFVLDGEGVLTDAAGVSQFDQLHGHRRYTAAFLQAFDVLSLDGDDLRRLPLLERKAKLAALLADSFAGIVNDGYVKALGAVVLAKACQLGLEGIVSKKIDAPYRSGRSGDWIKVRNPEGHAAKRFADRALK
jgi:bifunctional non-homologous end joining protein LigD